MNKKNNKSIAAQLGKRGGKATSKARGKAYMSALGKKGAKKRWSLKVKK